MSHEPRYVDVINRAREIASDIVSSLPAGDDASVAKQVEAQCDVSGAARDLGYDATRFRELVEREVTRLYDDSEDKSNDCCWVCGLTVVCDGTESRFLGQSS